MAYPTLNPNKAYSALFNMISRIVTHGNYIANKSVTKLADKARIEGAEFGDTVIYRASDLLKSREFDPDDANVLDPEQIAKIKEQPIVMEVFRQIGLTLPTSFLAKQACDAEGSWAAMASVLEGLLRDTKDFHDGRTYNVFLGTDKGYKSDATTEQKVVVGSDGKTIATNVVKLVNELGDGTRDYNEYGFMRSYNKGDLKFVWNADYLAQINYQELPAVFHDEALKAIFSEENVLPGKYFGKLNDAKDTSVATDRAAEECEINGVVYYPGDLIPAGKTIKGISTYTADSTIVGKVYSELPPFMSGIDTASEFNNVKNFSRNLYLTWGHNTLEHLKDCPSITLVTK
jgi:hypothetical protein